MRLIVVVDVTERVPAHIEPLWRRSWNCIYLLVP